MSDLHFLIKASGLCSGIKGLQVIPVYFIPLVSIGKNYKQNPPL